MFQRPKRPVPHPLADSQEGRIDAFTNKVGNVKSNMGMGQRRTILAPG